MVCCLSFRPVLVFLILISVFLCSPGYADTAVPVADFSASMVNGMAPFTAQFTDLSENAAAWSWDFGDGSTSHEQNPSHTYGVGTWTVTLTVTGGTLTDTRTRTGYITVQPDLMSTWTPTATATPYLPTSSATTPVTATAIPSLTGSISVTTIPKGATVFLDNAQQGIAPITLYHVATGPHTIRVHEKGFTDNTTQVTVEYEKQTDLLVDLTLPKVPAPPSPTATLPATTPAQENRAPAAGIPPAVGSISISCSDCLKYSSVDYSLFPSNGGRAVAAGTVTKSPIEIKNLPPGSYELWLSAPSCRGTYTMWHVVAGQTTTGIATWACIYPTKSPGFGQLLVFPALAITGLLWHKRRKGRN